MLEEEKRLDKGKLDFGQVAYNHLIGMLSELRNGNYMGFVDGVEGLYLIFYPYAITDEDFVKADKKLFTELGDEKIKIDGDLRLFPDDKDLMISALGLHIAKKRLANLMILARKYKLMFEEVDRGEVWELSEEEKNADTEDDTEVEI